MTEERIPLTETPEYHEELVAAIRGSTDAFIDACNAVADPFKPIEEGGWNTHQVAAHVREVEANVYGMRIRRSIDEDNPLFPNYDGDAWMAEHYDAQEPLAKILAEFLDDAAELSALLRSQPETVWSRPSRHETNGDFVLQTWVERALAHIREHLETVQEAERK
jgi:hypothetical protein